MPSPELSAESIELVVSADRSGVRLDYYLAQQFPSYSRVLLRRVINAAAVQVNGKRLDIPSYIVRVGDKLTLEEGARKFKFVAAAIAGADKRPIASWLDVDRANFTGTVKGAPVREDLNEHALRRMAVLRPIKVVIENYDPDLT